ncbi:hypothetical protein EDC01DRAFT_781966 [Geopyxis carbonaria]|nr:hypothetical protein EDC01DRAFT_781966 [Geopyxis carbonaria]
MSTDSSASSEAATSSWGIDTTPPQTPLPGYPRPYTRPRPATPDPNSQEGIEKMQIQIYQLKAAIAEQESEHTQILEAWQANGLDGMEMNPRAVHLKLRIEFKRIQDLLAQQRVFRRMLSERRKVLAKRGVVVGGTVSASEQSDVGEYGEDGEGGELVDQGAEGDDEEEIDLGSVDSETDEGYDENCDETHYTYGYDNDGTQQPQRQRGGSSGNSGGGRGNGGGGGGGGEG